MINRFLSKFSKILAISILAIFMNYPVFATDGYFGVAFGTKNKGMGGAGIALYQHSLLGANNPAGMFKLGTKFSFSISAFNPNRSYTVEGAPTMPSPTSFPPPFGLTPGTYESINKLFPMPAIAINIPLNEKSSISIGMYGNGGMNSEYETKTFYAQYLDGAVMPDGSNPMNGVSSPTGISMMQGFGTLSFSRELYKGWSAGLTAIGAAQAFQATGLQAFGNFGMSMYPDALTNNDYDMSYGFGGKIGIMGPIVKGLSMGATYQTELNMSAFDKYKGLFAEEGKFNVPANWTAGLAYETGKMAFAVDVKQIFYSKVKAVGNVITPSALMPYAMGATGLVPNPNYVPLGSTEGSGFGWKDMTIFKVGAQYSVCETMDLRAGFSHGNNPVQTSEVLFNILAPAVIENHVTLGFTKKFGKKELDFAIVRALNNKVTGANRMDPAQTITIEMNQWEFEIGFSF